MLEYNTEQNEENSFSPLEYSKEGFFKFYWNAKNSLPELPAQADVSKNSLPVNVSKLKV